MVDGAAPCIFVVDDHRAMRELVRASLHQIGYRNTIVDCEDGEVALHKLAQCVPRLIISDLNMPKLDGLGLLRAIRAQSRLKLTPFIMLTSRGELGSVKQAVEIGANGYLVKPFSLAALKKKIEAAISPEAIVSMTRLGMPGSHAG